MQRVFLHFAVGAAVFLTAIDATAMGFGQTTTQTTLGQPLNFVASVSLGPDESIARECVFAEVFAGDARVATSNVRVVLEAAPDSSTRNIRVTTANRIDEPVVTVELSVGCTSRMSRRFVAFIDPPAVQLAEASAPLDGAPPPSSSSRRDPQSMMLTDIARSADASRRRLESGAPAVEGAPPHRAARAAARGQRAATERSTTANASSRPNAGSRVASPTRVASRTRRASSRNALVGVPNRGARLQLEAPVAAVAPQVAASAPPAPDASAAPELAAAAAAANSAVAALQRERDRIQILEAGLAKLREDSALQQRTLMAMQARLREAESERYANGLVYSLAGVALLFALIALGLWKLRPRQRQRARWFDAAALQQARAAKAAANGPVTAAPEPPSPLTEPPTSWNSQLGSMPAPLTAPPSIGGLEVTTVLGPEAARANFDAARAGGGLKRSGELSMEELIDLEQQAEFFVVLGQDEAAIALLDGYLRSEGGKSPLPYLQLLELHQRRGDRENYESVREAFNGRFQAFAPEWSDDVHYGRELDEYPQTVARLQSLWPTPLSAMQALDSLLFRRHATDDTFDFPAYRELLFLYSIARELSGHVETDFGSIDVLLPLEDAPIDLTPTTPDAGAFAVDLDVSTWGDDTAPSNLVIRRSPGRHGAG